MSLLSSNLWSNQQVEMLNEYINSQLQEPEMVAERIENERNSKRHKRMKSTLKQVEKFIKKHDGILYGGLAMNAYLPDSLKFYDANTIPDYDFFIPNTLERARELADLLKSNGGQFVEMKSALHDGTYKVFENFEAVADLTSISDKEFNILRELAVNIKVDNVKVLVAPLDFIKAASYLELCLPLGASHRWTKVYKRLMLLENAYPLAQLDSQQSMDDLQSYIDERTVDQTTFSEIYKFVKRYLKLNNKIFVGIEALKYYLLNTSERFEYLHDIQNNNLEVLDVHHERTIKDVESKLRAFKIDYMIKTFGDFSSFVPKKHVIFVRRNKRDAYIKLLSVYEADLHCFSYVPQKNMCSIFFLMYIFYFKQVVEYDPLVDNIIVLLKQTMSQVETFENFLTSFTEICYGNEISPTKIKQNIWQKEKKLTFYRPN